MMNNLEIASNFPTAPSATYSTAWYRFLPPGVEVKDRNTLRVLSKIMKKLNSYQGKTKAIIGKIELLFHIVERLSYKSRRKLRILHERLIFPIGGWENSY